VLGPKQFSTKQPYATVMKKGRVAIGYSEGSYRALPAQLLRRSKQDGQATEKNAAVVLEHGRGYGIAK